MRKIIKLFAYFFITSSCNLISIIPEQSLFFYKNYLEGVGKANLEENLKIEVMIDSEYLFANKSFDPQGNTVPLFGKYGCINFENFAKTNIGKNKTTNLYQANNLSKTLAFQQNIIDNFDPCGTHLYASGKLDSFETILGCKIFFPIFPVYLSIHLPIQSIGVKEIKFTDRDEHCNDFSIFVNQEFDEVLTENGFEKLSTDIKSLGVSDIILKAGWSAKEDFDSRFVKSSWIDVSAGASLPFSGFYNSQKNLFIHIPIGTEGSTGMFLKYSGGANLLKGVSVHGFGEHLMFFRTRTNFSVPLHKDIPFFVFPQKLELDLKRGSYWKVGGDVRTPLFCKGLYLSLGYSYNSQEQSTIETNEEVFVQKKLYDLNEISKIAAIPNSIDKYNQENRCSYFINESLMNDNPRLLRSYSHLVHFGITFDSSQLESQDKDDLVGRFGLFFSTPIFGKASFLAKSFHCGAGMQFEIKF